MRPNKDRLNKRSSSFPSTTTEKVDFLHSNTNANQTKIIPADPHSKTRKGKTTKPMKPIQRHKEKLPKPSIRFDKYEHWPEFDDPKEGRKGFKCKKEGCGHPSPFYCSKCKVHLCCIPGQKNRNCFKDFHLFEKN